MCLLEKRIGDNEEMVNEVYQAYQKHKSGAEPRHMSPGRQTNLLSMLDDRNQTIAAIQKSTAEVRGQVDGMRDTIRTVSERSDEFDRAD